MKRPRVAITTYAQQAAWGPWHRDAALLPTTYVDAVLAAGGVPVLLPPIAPERAAEALRGVDAVVLAGGADVHPTTYGATGSPTEQAGIPDRDAFELAAVRVAIDHDLPMLGICRGLQILNVARGGSLIAHLPDRVGHEGHQPAPGQMGVHRVRLRERSLIGKILGPAVDVPTYHHQAANTLGAGLDAVGWAEDGVIEALELRCRTFIVGVQWHPEEGRDRRLFEALVTAARGVTAA